MDVRKRIQNPLNVLEKKLFGRVTNHFGFYEAIPCANAIREPNELLDDLKKDTKNYIEKTGNGSPINEN